MDAGRAGSSRHRRARSGKMGVVAWTTTKDRLLVAAPSLTDPNFDRSVVYVLEHNAEGALGVVLNRPGHLPAAAAVPNWAERATEPSMLYDGGPVEPGGVIGLGRRTSDGMPTPVDLSEEPEGHDPEVDQVRLFNGYAGWGAGQLEFELSEHAWIVLDARSEDVFGGDPLELWRSVLARQPGRLAWLATYPDDVEAN
jgi:putative transcriptional regulator